MKALARHTAALRRSCRRSALFPQRGSGLSPAARAAAQPQPVAPAPAAPARAGARSRWRPRRRTRQPERPRSTPSAARPVTAPRRPPAARPNLFDDQWVRAKDDEGIAAVIADGVPQTEMIPFKDAADRSADLAARRVSEDAGRQRQAASDLRRRRRRAGDQDRETDLQDRGRRARHRDAVGPRVPARRTPARHRARRQAAHHSEGQVGHRRRPSPARPRPGSGRTPGYLDVEVHPQYAKNGWIYLSYSEPRPELHAAAPAA